MPRHWLVKSEPFKYSFEQLVRDGRTHWDGVRNFEARNNLRAMAPGDLLLFYHSNEGLAVVGVARVAREAYADPTAPGEDWSVVDLEPLAPLPEPVPLTTIRTTPALAAMALLRRSRLSVTPVTPAEFDAVVRLGKADPNALAKPTPQAHRSTKRTAASEPSPKRTAAPAASAKAAAKGMASTKAATAKGKASTRAATATKGEASSRGGVTKGKASTNGGATKGKAAARRAATESRARGAASSSPRAGTGR